MASAGAVFLLGGSGLSSALGEVRVAPGLRVEEVATGIARPVELALNAAGNLVVLSRGWRGDAAGEIYQMDLRGALPTGVSRAPRVVIPFSEGTQKTIFGSLAIDPRSGDLFLGEENGSRIYRLTADERLATFAVGLNHLVGGSSLAFDHEGRLVVVDFASAAGRLRSETPPPPALDWLTGEAYNGPLVFRLDLEAGIPHPRRLDLVAPIFPRPSRARGARELLPRFISVATSPTADLVLLSSLGEVFRLTSEGALQWLARLPGGDYQRTHLAVAPDGAVFVSSGFHIREIFRVSSAGVVTTVARELGDPGGVVLDPAGNLYIAETARHRIIRIRPAP